MIAESMSWVQALVLGAVQGLTEFLPVSSSAHLRIVSEVFFGDDAGASFTAVTQLGTEAAVLLYFARDIGRIIAAWFRGIADKSQRDTLDYRMGWYVIFATIPIGVLGLAFEDLIKGPARNLYLNATVLIVFALFFWVPQVNQVFFTVVDALVGLTGAPDGASAIGRELFRFWNLAG